MGLLNDSASGGDAWGDPRSSGNAFLAMAQAIAPRNRFVGGLLNYGNSVSAAQDHDLKRRGLLMDMEAKQSEIEQRKAAIAKQAALQEYAQRFLQPGGFAPASQGQLGSGSFGAMPTAPGQSDMPARRPGGLGGKSLEEVTAFHMMGGPDLTNAWKLAREGFERKPGSFYESLDGRREYIADPVKGVNYQNGRVGLMPGAVDTQTALTLASEAPKALLGAAGRVNLRQNADGTQSPISELSENPTLQNILGGLFGGQAPVPRPMGQPAPAVPGAPVGAPPMRVSPEQQRGADAESIRMIQAELQNPNPPPAHRQAMEREVARLTQAQTQPGFPAPSMIRNPGQGYGMTNEQAAAVAAAKVKAEADARAESERQAGRAKKSESASDMLGNIKRARTLLQMNPTESMLGAGVDKALSFGGMTTQSGNVASSLEALAGWLTSNTPRMEGPQSNMDVEAYKIMAGRVGDRTLPVPQRLAALEEVERIQKTYAHLNGGQAEQPKAERQVIDALPKSAPKGQRVRDTQTGEVLIFNGLSWVKEK